MTDALVLQTSPYSESTLIVRLLTREEGVVRVLAKGARRIKGQNSALFDLMAHVKVGLRMPAHDRLGILRSADLKQSWMYLRSDLKRFALACAALEIVGAVAQDSPLDTYFFDEAFDFLTRLESANAPGSLTAALLLRLLHHAGYPPRLDERLAGQPLPARMAYDFSEGTFIERPAWADDERAGSPRRIYAISRALTERIIPSLASPPPLNDEFVIPANEGPDLIRWLVRLWEDHLHQPIKSAQFLEKTTFSGL